MNKSEIDQDSSCLVTVTEAWSGRTGQKAAKSAERARWYCEQLEQGRILFFKTIPFPFPEADQEFLRGQRLGDSRLHKNISYRPAEDILRGYAGTDRSMTERMHAIMRQYSQEVLAFLGWLLAPYAPHWSLDYASFRPEAEQDRHLPLRKRNDLLHVDAFPSRPTRGGRILRCFSNINTTHPRIWQTTDTFPALASAHAREAGLAAVAENGGSPLQTLTRVVKKAFGAKSASQSSYDRFMLRFHDYLKENGAFQENCPKIRLEFQPESTWICFTDSVPHAVLEGQYAVEQTVIVPISAMIAPETSPLRVLEKIAARPLVSLSA